MTWEKEREGEDEKVLTQKDEWIKEVNRMDKSMWTPERGLPGVCERALVSFQ
ncbi:hypothetical protein GBF38_005151, partial [Nibea albiflora]